MTPGLFSLTLLLKGLKYYYQIKPSEHEGGDSVKIDKTLLKKAVKKVRQLSGVNFSGVLWNKYNGEYSKYEKEFPYAFPWSKAEKEDVPRYVKGSDGYWYNPQAAESGKAILSCTGDIMCEPGQHRAYKFGDSYFFHPQFKFVRDIFKKSDFVVGNLETTLTDITPYAGEVHRLEGGGYHCNAPACYLDSIRYAGFDALVNANNHNCDSAVTGLMDTLNALDERHFMHTGTFRPTGDERVLYVKVNGIKLGIISYATYFNKIETNFTKLGRETLLNAYSKQKAEADIGQARSNGAEYVIVYIHWGTEYTHSVSDKQKQWAQELADAGADYIVGTHTHCLEPHGIVTAADGRKVPVIYSMGNFVTTEYRNISKHTGILQLVLEKASGKVELKSESFIPCYVFNEFKASKYAAVPADIRLNGGYVSQTLNSADKYIREVIGDLPVLETAAITISELCEVLGAEMPEGVGDRALSRLCSRAVDVTDGSGYFGITANEDAELEKARKKGAAVIITDRQVGELPCIVVDDIDEAYCKAYSHLRSRFDCKTVAVTGTEGRSEAKEILEKLIGESFISLCSPEKWDNRHSGMLVMQQLRHYHEVYVQEVCADEEKSASMMSRAIMPDYAVISDIGQISAESLLGITDSMQAGGVLFVNGDDARLMDSVRSYAGDKLRVVTFGINADKLDFKAEKLSCDGKKLRFDIVYGDNRAEVVFQYPVKTSAYSILAAFAVGLECGADVNMMLSAIGSFESKGLRQNILEYEGLKLFIDCRSATPASMRASIEGFCSMPVKMGASRIAVLGDMQPCENSKEEHIKIGQLVATTKIDWLFCIGSESERICSAAVEAGFNPTHAKHFKTKRALELELCRLLKQGDALLIKGDRRMYLNTTVRKLFGINYYMD